MKKLVSLLRVSTRIYPLALISLSVRGWSGRPLARETTPSGAASSLVSAPDSIRGAACAPAVGSSAGPASPARWAGGVAGVASGAPAAGAPARAADSAGAAAACAETGAASAETGADCPETGAVCPTAVAQERLVDLGPARFLATLTAKSLAEVDEWQTEMQLKPMRLGRVQLYTTGLDAEERRITGVEIIDSVDAAVAASVARHNDPDVAIIPEGPYVVPLHG